MPVILFYELNKTSKILSLVTLINKVNNHLESKRNLYFTVKCQFYPLALSLGLVIENF